MRHWNLPTIILSALVGYAGAQEANKLTTAETSAGYDLLFNGTDLNNWHAYRGGAASDGFKLKTTAPLGARIETGSGSQIPILTNKKYKNFDLKADVQVTADGNSGIFVRYEETAISAGATRSGPEFQICGPNNSDCNGATKHFGSCYDMFGVKSSIRNTWYNPVGTWNQIRIIAFDSNYVHYGNGKKLLEYKIGTPDFLTAYNQSKYVDDGNNGNYYNIHTGGILLQHHSEQGLSFRNLKAKELAIHPFNKEFTNRQWPDSLPHDFVFGVTSTSHESMEGFVAPSISVRFAGSGLTLVDLPSGYSDLQVIGVDGRAVPYRKVSADVLSIQGGQKTTGIVILRLRVQGHRLARIVTLHR